MSLPPHEGEGEDGGDFRSNDDLGINVKKRWGHYSSRNPARSGKPMIVVLLAAALMIPLCISAHAEGFEPYTPRNEQLRQTILGIIESHTLRPSPMLEQRVREALRSIAETEGWTAPQLSELLSSRLKATWTDLERSRAVSGLGYTEFDDETFHAAESKFQDLLILFVGTRTPYSGERYQVALGALDNVQALSRNARRAVPGLSSDDVLLMREKRQKLLREEVKEDRGFSGGR